MRIDLPPLIAAALGIAVVAGLVFGGATSAAAFGSYNPNWEGTSELRSIAETEGAEPVVLRNTSTYDQHGAGDVTFILAPSTGYNASESDRIRAFVERGGTLVVAERDGEPGLQLLEEVGAQARPVGPVLRDEQNNYRSPALPVANNVSDHTLVSNVTALTLNYGTAVRPNGADVLVSSSPFSYLDRDGSGSVSNDESVRSYPVATVEPVGDGQVVVVADPSVFINAMQGQAGNEAFTRSLVADADHAIIDVSRSSLPPLVAGLLTVRESPFLQVICGVLGLGAVAVGGRIASRRATSDSIAQRGDTELTAGLQSHYPSLSESRLLKASKGVNRSREEATDNE